MTIRNLCQKGYTKAPINKAKGINEACVMTCVQMIAEKWSGVMIDQDIFYEKSVENLAIREDCYVNNYDRLLTAFFHLNAFEFFSYIGYRTMPAMYWHFSHDMKDLKEQLNRENPVVCYLGGHAVLAIDVIDDHNASPQRVTVVDPKFSGDKAVYAMDVAKIKRLGFYK